jgi:integrative and conjugative element protein (TIGR02256 family)
MELIYIHKGCSQRLVFSAAVVEHFAKHRQTTGPEVGGQLFGIMEDAETITVTLATGPRREDQKRRFLFVPCRFKERREISAQFKKGLHYLGDWHTHPEPKPTPSDLDLESMKDCFSKSRHQHRSFVMIIVGNEQSEGWLWVSLHDKAAYIRMETTPPELAEES